jgi:hypothetical protein
MQPWRFTHAAILAAFAGCAERCCHRLCIALRCRGARTRFEKVRLSAEIDREVNKLSRGRACDPQSGIERMSQAVIIFAGKTDREAIAIGAEFIEG